MAINRLYPPIIAGTIPSFYTTNTGTSLEVPFSMNVTVSNAAVKGMRLRLKTTSTDIVIANVVSQKYGDDAVNRSVIYELDNDIVAKLVVGNFYKVQLAYIDQSDNDGYYSTVAIVKYTAEPTIGIADLNMQSLTAISANTLIGTYANSDASEKAYQYRFVFTNLSGIVLQDTGWLVHNIQTNTSLDKSQDECLIAFNLTEGQTYRVQYSVITNNGLILHSVNYEIVKSSVTVGSLDVYLSTTVDNDNARVIIQVFPNKTWLTLNETDEYLLKGSFLICRKDENNAKNLWETLTEVNINMALKEDRPYEFIDYAIESGGKYHYSIQKFNSKKIYSDRVSTLHPVIPYFEDAYLYDGQKQLRIRFNPTVNTFKSVLSETKKTTLGRQYPFILRNGILNYKEFPIGGLISYYMDNDELFISKRELNSDWGIRETAGTRYYKDYSTTDLVDENYTYERKFKLAVLEWLNDGGIKLFKSPQEGSYIVRLTNVSLTPNTTVSRLLHSFSCTASQVDTFSIAALSNYNLLTTQVETVYTDSEYIVDLQSLAMLLGSANALSKYDLTEGKGCRKIKFVWSLDESNTNKQNLTYGMNFEWGEYNFSINHTGKYEIELNAYSTAPLLFTNPPEVLSNITGYLYLTLESYEADNLDSVQEMLSQTLYGLSLYGLEEPMENYTYETTELILDVNGKPELNANGDKVYRMDTETFSRNVFENWNGFKGGVSKMVYIEYRNIPVYPCGYNTLEYTWNSVLPYGAIPAAFQYGDQILLQKNDGTYWQYIPNPAHLIPDSATGKYPLVTVNDFKQITNYGTKVLFGSQVVDIDELFTSEDDDTTETFRTTLPLNVRGKLDLRVQPGVQVYVYCRAETRTYALEEQYGEMDNLTALELKAYEDYLAAKFNFKASVPQAGAEVGGNYIYVFDNRQFIEVNAYQATEYLQGGHTLYVANYPNIYDEDHVEELRIKWIQARTNLNNYLAQELIQEEEKEEVNE